MEVRQERHRHPEVTKPDTPHHQGRAAQTTVTARPAFYAPLDSPHHMEAMR